MVYCIPKEEDSPNKCADVPILRGVLMSKSSESFMKERMEKVGCTQLYDLLKYGIIGYMYN
jgi:hypothetical protein